VNHWFYNIYETCLVETCLDDDDAAPTSMESAFRKRRRRNDILKGTVIFALQNILTFLLLDQIFYEQTRSSKQAQHLGMSHRGLFNRNSSQAKSESKSHSYQSLKCAYKASVLHFFTAFHTIYRTGCEAINLLTSPIGFGADWQLTFACLPKIDFLV